MSPDHQEEAGTARRQHRLRIPLGDDVGSHGAGADHRPAPRTLDHDVRGATPPDDAAQADRWSWTRALLRLRCPHARRDVFRDGLRGTNTLPFHRLFLVPPGSPRDGGQVVDTVTHRHLPLSPSSILLLPAQRNYRFEFAPGLHLAGFHFRLESAPGQDVIGPQVRFQRRPDQDGMTLPVWHALGLGTCDAWLRCEGLLHLCLGRMISLSWADLQEAISVRSRWREVLDAIEHASGPGPGVADLALIAGVSREHFSRAFRADFQVSPRHWLNRRRAERAVERLLASTTAVGALAADLGFSDPFAFSRFIRRSTGASPTQLRAMGPWGSTGP